MHRSYLAAALLGTCLSFPGSAPAAEACSSYAADLAAMASADQALRKRFNFLEPHSREQRTLIQQAALVDRTNTARLKTLIDVCGWPSKATHGEQAARDAWLLAQHADQDVAFQKKVLALIEQAAAASGEGVNHEFAFLADRIAVAEKRPQLYGTQIRPKPDDACDLDFAPLDDRDKVEQRRAQLKLAPLDDYQRMVKDMQHCPTGSAKDYHYAPPVAKRNSARDGLRRK